MLCLRCRPPSQPTHHPASSAASSSSPHTHTLPPDNPHPNRSAPLLPLPRHSRPATPPPTALLLVQVVELRLLGDGLAVVHARLTNLAVHLRTARAGTQQRGGTGARAGTQQCGGLTERERWMLHRHSSHPGMVGARASHSWPVLASVGTATAKSMSDVPPQPTPMCLTLFPHTLHRSTHLASPALCTLYSRLMRSV